MTPRTKAQMFIQILRDMVEADRAVRWARQLQRNIADGAQYRELFPAGRFERHALGDTSLRRPLPERAFVRVLNFD